MKMEFKKPEYSIDDSSSLEDIQKLHRECFMPNIKTLRTGAPLASDDALKDVSAAILGFASGSHVAWYLNKLELEVNGHISSEDMPS